MCAAYIGQVFDSSAKVADVEWGLLAQRVVGNHISCRAEHAGFDVPAHGSTAAITSSAGTHTNRRSLSRRCLGSHR
jgi:hypothetical protein